MAALALLGIGFFVARSLTEKTPQGVQEQKASVESLRRATAPPPQPVEQRNEEPATGALVEKASPRVDARAEAAGPSSAETVPFSSRARLTKVNPKDGLRYVWIPPGTFTMGCSTEDSECDGDERPAHQRAITRGFWLDKPR